MDCNAWLLLAFIPLVFLFKYLFKSASWSTNEQVMRGKTVLITGANTGIGFETAAELARYGAKVILACRDGKRASKAREAIIERLISQPNHSDIQERVVIEELDLASFDSIRACADRLSKLPRLDVLINNAGLAYISNRQLTNDGLELTIGTNHFGHFLLTNLLLPLLKKSAPSRIIIVSSEVYRTARLDFDNLNCERSYPYIWVYPNSKLANMLFAHELSRKLQGSGVIVNALHPGIVTSDIARNFPSFANFMFKTFLRFVLKSPLQGAQTSIYLAASDAPEVLKGGLYFSNCRVVKPSAVALDDASARKLWEVSERLTHLI